MVGAPGLVEWRPIAARHGETDVRKVERSSDMRRIVGIAQADPPRPAIRLAADQSDLAQISVDMATALAAEQVGDRVGDKALADRIERDAHARTPERDPAPANVDQAIIDQPFRD